LDGRVSVIPSAITSRLPSNSKQIEKKTGILFIIQNIKDNTTRSTTNRTSHQTQTRLFCYSMKESN
jgi:hypothetical protein